MNAHCNDPVFIPFALDFVFYDYYFYNMPIVDALAFKMSVKKLLSIYDFPQRRIPVITFTSPFSSLSISLCK